MIRKTILAAAAIAAFGIAGAQERCIIEGRILGNDQLRYSQQTLTKVYLAKQDESGEFVAVDSAAVANRQFRFERTLAAGEPALIYLITGFDNGEVNLFVEPGTIEVKIRDAGYPSGAVVTGTRNNDLMGEYTRIQDACVQRQVAGLNQYLAQHGQVDDFDPAFLEYRKYLAGTSLLNSYSEILKFCVKNCDSPYIPLLLERQLSYTLSPETCLEWFPGLVSPELHDHPYYKSMVNSVLAQNLGAGSQLPDIKLPTTDGNEMMLSDLRGKYVLLDFWASWCAPCRREIPYIIKVWEMAQGRDDFAIVSFSLDSKDEEWRPAIESLGMNNRKGWIHASDLRAWSSPAAQALSVDAVPKSILIDPEGRAVAFDLRGEELIHTMEDIFKGN